MKKTFFITLLIVLFLSASAQEKVDLSKYKFVPGEKTLIYEDFSDVPIKEIPEQEWEINGNAEVIELEGGRWLKMEENTELVPTYNSFPGKLTIEFYLYGRNFFVHQIYLKFENEKVDYGSWVNIGFNYINWGGSYGDKEIPANNMEKLFYEEKTIVPVSMAIEKKKMTLYVNRRRVAIVNRFFPVDVKKITFECGSFPDEEDENNLIAITGIRIATGIPKIADKILKEGKYISHGIHFAHNSFEIRPESYSILREVANVIKATPGLRLRIVGHTDSSGSKEYNEKLSMHRAKAVKDYLTKEFGIDETRLEVEGKGQSNPIADNVTPEVASSSLVGPARYILYFKRFPLFLSFNPYTIVSA